MANGYLKRREADYQRGLGDGIEAGLRLHGMVEIIAMYNVLACTEFDIPNEIYAELEQEEQRIIDEYMEISKNDVKNAFDLLEGHVNEIRKKKGMEHVDWGFV